MARVKRTGRAKATGNGKTALFLGGGAPNFTLMSGALLALHEKGIRFDIVSMAGAGAVVGLMYLVPKGMTRNSHWRTPSISGLPMRSIGSFP